VETELVTDEHDQVLLDNDAFQLGYAFEIVGNRFFEKDMAPGFGCLEGHGNMKRRRVGDNHGIGLSRQRLPQIPLQTDTLWCSYTVLTQSASKDGEVTRTEAPQVLQMTASYRSQPRDENRRSREGFFGLPRGRRG
jgi:hypothetical protein